MSCCNNECNQGRNCPNRGESEKAILSTWGVILLAPIIILSWMIMNPKKVWDEAKRGWYCDNK